MSRIAREVEVVGETAETIELDAMLVLVEVGVAGLDLQAAVEARGNAHGEEPVALADVDEQADDQPDELRREDVQRLGARVWRGAARALAGGAVTGADRGQLRYQS